MSEKEVNEELVLNTIPPKCSVDERKWKHKRCTGIKYLFFFFISILPAIILVSVGPVRLATILEKKVTRAFTGTVDMWRRHEKHYARVAFANNFRDKSHMSTDVRTLLVRFLKRRSCPCSCEGHRIVDEEHAILKGQCRKIYPGLILLF